MQKTTKRIGAFLTCFILAAAQPMGVMSAMADEMALTSNVDLVEQAQKAQQEAEAKAAREAQDLETLETMAQTESGAAKEQESQTEAADEAAETASVAVVQTAGTGIYAEDSEGAVAITTAGAGDTYKVNGRSDNGWVEVKIGDTDGYVKPDGSVRLDQAVSAASAACSIRREAEAEEEAQRRQALRESVVDYALSFVGYPYVYGGSDPHSGADCSGFVRYVLANAAGVHIGRSSVEQAQDGTAISSDQLRPGDLIFYARGRGEGGGIGHVAMYIGDGEVVHASTEATGIKVSQWDYKTPLKIVSVLE